MGYTRFQCAAALTAWLVLSGPALAAQPQAQQILVLQSFHRGSLPVDYFTGNFRVDLDQRTETPVNVIQIVIGPTGFVGAPDQAVVDYIRSTFADRGKPDLIVTVAGPAAVFAREHRQELFPEIPLLLASVDQRFLRDTPLGENETAVAVANDFPGLIDDILRLLPQTRQVFMVMGSGPLGQFWRRELEAQFKHFGERLTFIWSNDLSLPEILRRCASLPRDSAIVYIAFGTDAQGGAYADERVLADLHATANAPIFSSLSPFLGLGIVGARLMSMDELSRSAADVAARILNGTPPESIVVPPQQPSPQPIFDWRELQRWEIPESRLPAGSVVRYRTPSLWSAYRRTVLSAAGVLAVQLLLILGLLYERRARQRAEIDSRRNLALAADASRRHTMSVLANSIAHELGQPLSSMIYNTQALQTMVAGNRATGDAMGEILSDIQSQGLRATQIIDRNRTMLRSHDALEKKPIDLHAVVNESLALVAHDMDARQVRTTVVLPVFPCIISGDEVLLQQVFVNLIMNATDAMAATPPPERRLTIRSEVRVAEVEVSVRDNGTGVPPEVIDRLFSPFLTTKSLGLGIGLTIVRKIVEAHGGSIAASNNPDGGATFVVTLPRSTPGG